MKKWRRNLRKAQTGTQISMGKYIYIYMYQYVYVYTMKSICCQTNNNADVNKKIGWFLTPPPPNKNVDGYISLCSW